MCSGGAPSGGAFGSSLIGAGFVTELRARRALGPPPPSAATIFGSAGAPAPCAGTPSAPIIELRRDATVAGGCARCAFSSVREESRAIPQILQ
eukprot:504010-Prymnesium_polylepis.1